MRPHIRDYVDTDEPSWLRCRVLSFLGSPYYDDVQATRAALPDDAVRLVAVAPRPERVRTPGDEQVVGIMDVELWEGDAGERQATIDTVAVHPDHQRAGIATALLTEAQQRLGTMPPAARPATLDAWTREDGEANGWYSRCGFAVDTEYLHVYARDDEVTEDFRTPEGLSAPVIAFCHGDLADEARWRERFARVHRCRRYVQPVKPRLWTLDTDLARLYDVESTGRHDHDFYLALATELRAHQVVDIGCGTGALAVELAARGHTVTGVDPAGPMLAVARSRAGGEQVTWVHGQAGDLPAGAADLAIMEGHVAQYFVADESWAEVLRAAQRALAPGGHLAFESRRPEAKAWLAWTEAATRATYPHPDGSPFESWVDSVELDEHAPGGPVETHVGHTLLADGRHLRSAETLRFRPQQELVDSLGRAGFTVVDVWGDWDRSPVTDASPEHIVLARW